MNTKTIIEKINQTESIKLGDHVIVILTGIEEYQMEESRYNQKTHIDQRSGSGGEVIPSRSSHKKRLLE